MQHEILPYQLSLMRNKSILIKYFKIIINLKYKILKKRILSKSINIVTPLCFKYKYQILIFFFIVLSHINNRHNLKVKYKRSPTKAEAYNIRLGPYFHIKVIYIAELS